MSEKTNIAWTDSTINFWSGCTMVPAANGLKDSGCLHCYAKTRDDRHMIERVSHWGKGAPRLKHKGAVKDALAFNRKPWSDGTGTFLESACEGFHRRRIFSLSLGDWLDDEVPIEWLAEMLDTIRQCADVTWILCTKRPENFERRLEAVAVNGTDYDVSTSVACFASNWKSGAIVPTNIILLASVENQAMADKRIPELLKIPAACRGLSLEPLLGPVDISDYLRETDEHGGGLISWAIIGGESGTGARTCDMNWINSLVKQGIAAGVATFVKQLGANVPNYGKIMPTRCDKCGTISSGEPGQLCPSGGTGCGGTGTMWEQNLRDKKGGDISEWPQDLRVQQWPKGF